MSQLRRWHHGVHSSLALEYDSLSEGLNRLQALRAQVLEDQQQQQQLPTTATPIQG